MMENENVFEDFVRVSRKKMEDLKQDTEKAMMQMEEQDLFWSPNEQSNSVDILIKHMSGNLRSRWTDFLKTDGEKPDRDRDGEFESTIKTRGELLECWEAGCNAFFDALDSLKAEDLLRTIYIRKVPHTVMEAFIRSIVHTSNHVGQIIYIAKQTTTEEKWTTLSIPKKK